MILYKRIIHNLDTKRFLFRVLPTSLFCLLFVRYLFSDTLPQRSFPVRFRPETCDNCFPHPYRPRLLPGRAACSPGDTVRLVVLITTVPGAAAARAAVRETWGNRSLPSSAAVRFVFLFGGGYSPEEQSALEAEAHTHGDVLQEEFQDNYYNLSVKVIMGYKWVLEHCPQAQFVARSAEDNFINIPELLVRLTVQGALLQHTMVGDCENYALPWRWPFHKWAISLKEYRYILFPPYCIGTTFVTSLSMVQDLVRISPHVPFFPIEDVYFGMCVKQLGGKYSVRTLKGFNFLPMSSATEGGPCPYPKPLYSVHPLSTKQLRQIWTMCHF